MESHGTLRWSKARNITGASAQATAQQIDAVRGKNNQDCATVNVTNLYCVVINRLLLK